MKNLLIAHILFTLPTYIGMSCFNKSFDLFMFSEIQNYTFICCCILTSIGALLFDYLNYNPYKEEMKNNHSEINRRIKSL